MKDRNQSLLDKAKGICKGEFQLDYKKASLQLNSRNLEQIISGIIPDRAIIQLNLDVTKCIKDITAIETSANAVLRLIDNIRMRTEELETAQAITQEQLAIEAAKKPVDVTLLMKREAIPVHEHSIRRDRKELAVNEGNIDQLDSVLKQAAGLEVKIKNEITQVDVIKKIAPFKAQIVDLEEKISRLEKQKVELTATEASLKNSQVLIDTTLSTNSSATGGAATSGAAADAAGLSTDSTTATGATNTSALNLNQLKDKLRDKIDDLESQVAMLEAENDELKRSIRSLKLRATKESAARGAPAGSQAAADMTRAASAGGARPSVSGKFGQQGAAAAGGEDDEQPGLVINDAKSKRKP